MDFDVQHDESEGRYYAVIDGREAVCEYGPAGEGKLNFFHTYVPPEPPGRPAVRALRAARAALRRLQRLRGLGGDPDRRLGRGALRGFGLRDGAEPVARGHHLRRDARVLEPEAAAGLLADRALLLSLRRLAVHPAPAGGALRPRHRGAHHGPLPAVSQPAGGAGRRADGGHRLRLLQPSRRAQWGPRLGAHLPAGARGLPDPAPRGFPRPGDRLLGAARGGVPAQELRHPADPPRGAPLSCLDGLLAPAPARGLPGGSGPVPGGGRVLGPGPLARRRLPLLPAADGGGGPAGPLPAGDRQGAVLPLELRGVAVRPLRSLAAADPRRALHGRRRRLEAAAGSPGEPGVPDGSAACPVDRRSAGPLLDRADP